MHITRLDKVVDDAIPTGVLRLDYASEVDGLDDWALLWPGESRTWVVCIHGHGSHGDQLYIRENMRRAWLVPFKQRQWSILTPNLRNNAWMSPQAVREMHDLISFVRDSYHADTFIFFSGSMGGTSNLIYALLQPQDVSVAIALGAASDIASYQQWCRQRDDTAILNEIADHIELSYGGPPTELPEIYQQHSVLHNSAALNVPVFLAHGGADETIPPEQSRELNDRLTGKESFSYHEIPGGNHDAPLGLTKEAFNWIDKTL